MWQTNNAADSGHLSNFRLDSSRNIPNIKAKSLNSLVQFWPFSFQLIHPAITLTTQTVIWLISEKKKNTSVTKVFIWKSGIFPKIFLIWETAV